MLFLLCLRKLCSTKDICKLNKSLNLCRKLAGELGNEAFKLVKQVKK